MESIAAVAPRTETDSVLARRVADGDLAAFEALMRRHNRRLYRLARATLRDDREAEDALQDAYLLAYRRIGQFRGDAAFGTWLFRLVLNECLARLRRSARRDRVMPLTPLLDEDMDTMAPSTTEPPDRAAARSEVREILERKVDGLPESFRTVFVLRSVEEMSVEEVAACLGLPEATVRSRHFRARSLLRESLQGEFDVAERDLYEFGGARCDRIVSRVLQRVQS